MHQLGIKPACLITKCNCMVPGVLCMCVQKAWEGSLDEHNASNTWASVWKNKMKTSNFVSSNSIPDLNQLQVATGWLELCVISLSVLTTPTLAGSVSFFCLEYILSCVYIDTNNRNCVNIASVGYCWYIVPGESKTVEDAVMGASTNNYNYWRSSVH